MQPAPAALLVGVLIGAHAHARTGSDATTVEAFLATAQAADVVFLGEIHDNPAHHRIQAAIVKALAPAALVFEMIPQGREADVNDLRAAGADRAEIAASLDWSASGWPDFDMYAPILEAAPGARVFGAGQPPDAVRLAIEEGAAAAFGPDASTYGLDLPLPAAEQALVEAEMAVSHCDLLPVEMLPAMVEAQRFRDAGLADAALWARTLAGADEQVVVIAGNGHVDRRRGAPALIAIADPDVVVVTLGQGENSGAADGAPDGAFDGFLTAPAPERDDPCDALRQD